MRTLMAGIVAGLLTGCSLPASVVPGEPNLSKYSEKPPKEYAACVLPAWQKEVPKATQTGISIGYRIKAPAEFNGQVDEWLNDRRDRKSSAGPTRDDQLIPATEVTD